MKGRKITTILYGWEGLYVYKENIRHNIAHVFFP
jgi:hypothetical protein